MFGRWLSLFDAACAETQSPEAAAAFRERAAAIARSLRMGLFEPLPIRPRAEPEAAADAGVLPPGLERVRSTPVFTENTTPPGLLRRHRTAPGTWGLIRVLEGRLLYRVLDPPSERVLDPSRAPGVVAPGVPHEVAPLGPVRFLVEFHRAPPEARPKRSAPGVSVPARSALPITTSEEVAITAAAHSGVTSPATAAGTATRL